MKNLIIWGGLGAVVLLLLSKKGKAAAAPVVGGMDLNTKSGQDLYTATLQQAYGGNWSFNPATNVLTQTPAVSLNVPTDGLTSKDAEQLVYAMTSVYSLGSAPASLKDQALKFYRAYYGRTVSDVNFAKNLQTIFNRVIAEKWV